MSNINVYCPITSALIYVGSDRVDDLGQFTKFVLWAISNKYTINEISDAVSLGEIVVEDEVSYLSQIGFILDTESGFEITETGQGYLDLIASVDKFNNLHSKAYLNCFTGSVGCPNPTATINIPKAAFCLPGKISRFIIQNRDYQPLQEFARSEYTDYFSHLRPEFLNSLYFYLYPDDSGEPLFQEYSLSALPDINDQFSSSDGTMVILSRNIVCLHFAYEDDRLLRYRTVIDTLERLSIFDPSLLSTTAVELLKYARDERSVNINANPLYIDASTGSILSNRPIQEDLGLRQLVSIPIPDRPYKYNEYVEVAVSSGNTQYRRILKKTDNICLKQKVPFAIFEEVKPLDEP